jgi:hypothetical protein
MGWLTEISSELTPEIRFTTVTVAVTWRSGQVIETIQGEPALQARHFERAALVGRYKLPFPAGSHIQDPQSHAHGVGENDEILHAHLER